MKIVIVSVSLELPLAAYCLASQLANDPFTKVNRIQFLHLQTSRLNTYNQKNAEIWRYIAHIENIRPHIIMFSVYLWNVLIVNELIALSKRLYPDVHIVIGGPEVSTPLVVEQFLAAGAVTAAVMGEGEATAVEIVKRLMRSRTLRGVAGCSWLDGKSVVHEIARPLDKTMRFPSPYLTGWIKEDWFDRFEGTRLKKGIFPRALLETYRGCYMSCSYCQWGNGCGTRSRFPMARIQAELTWLISRNIARLFIVDAMFGYNLRSAKCILQHISDEKLKYGARTEIVCYHNRDFLDRELFDLYRQAGVLVEIDMQSSNEKVLDRLGRQRWSTVNFERHLAAFRQHGVKTTGAADLIIGLPGDRLASFSASVDFLLARGMNIGLYQTSIIPGSRLAQTIEKDGIVYSATAPRAVFKNKTFSVKAMVAARLLGHGVDFFLRYPITAKALCRLLECRPVELCRRIGQKIWQKFDLMYGETWQYSSVLDGMQADLAVIVREICLTDVVAEFFRLEAAMARLAMPEPGAGTGVARLMTMPSLDNESWMKESLHFRRDLVEIVSLKYRVDRLLAIMKKGEFPVLAAWRLEEDCNIALVYLIEPGQADYQIIDRDITWELLQRFNGYFTVEECLDNFLGMVWRGKNMSALRETLSRLAEAGLVVSGAWAKNQRFLELIKADSYDRLARTN